MLSNAQDNALLESQNSDFARGFVSGDFLPAMQAKRSYPMPSMIVSPSIDMEQDNNSQVTHIIVA
ncbi:hypothetical protein [Alloscardovia omnicolens]|uniref:hypothetical protein n=1 Tax=Alloscardovia omnicolens TaxID=419015 RepID=UPI00066606C4|nr:hypothetical protein [Alloscardovia omnicolens]MDK6327709.1 hypothetical protein [Alloscardovia omnicolens]MDK8073510.1 hypothetical protein [Alloscardovia omnicolens]MDK8081400.1 hypothetical protein [Alloscardovia omnicolens]